MRCPNCNHPAFDPTESCPACQFNGDPTLLEEWNHIDWVLNEINSWQMLGVRPFDRQRVHLKYIARQRELEVKLGLRLPPFTKEEAHDAWPELFQREALLKKMAEWLEAGFLKPETTQKMVEQASHQVDELLEQLEGHARLTYPQTDTDRLDLINFLLEAVDYLSQNQSFVTPEAKAQARSPLLAEKERLEIKLGLREESAEAPVSESIIQQTGEPVSQQVNISLTLEPLGAQASAASLPSASPADSSATPQPSIPFGERLWRTLLSERTLHALLFLGIFLLFAAAISFVIWGWKDFSAPMRVAIPTLFTSLFFGMGWYVRAKTPLYRSGIALSAIAALLIPIDFYTIYVNFDIPFEYWPQFWFLTSLFCLMAYIVVTLIIRSRFFGYLVGIAAGSTVSAIIEMGHQTFGLSTDWRTAGLSGLALCLIILATIFNRYRARELYLFADAFRYLSLLAVGIIMLLTFGWRYIDRDTYDTLHYALTINWWVGGFIFGWAAVYYRSRSLGLLAAIALPVATYLAQAVLFYQVGVNPAWHAFGFALLVPLYFITGYKLLAYKDDPVIHSHGRTATGWGVALLIVAALWPVTDLTNGAAAASSHAILTGSVILTALLWRRPAFLYVASLLSLSATTFAMTHLLKDLNLTPPQLSVGWTSLAIAHLIIAVNVGSRFPIPLPNYAKPLVITGYTIAALALLLPLFPYDGNLFAYALFNWWVLSAWGAWLAHVGQPGFVARDVERKTVFHWFTALSLPLWLWVIFTNRRALDFSLPLALAALSWGMVALSYRLEKVNKIYRLPWLLTGTLISIIAPVVAFIIVPNGLTPAITLLSAGLLYFTDAITRRQSGELVPAGLVTAWGYMLLLSRLRLSFDPLSFALVLLITLYFLAGLWTERQKSAVFTQKFLAPLYFTGHILSLLSLWWIYVRPFDKFIFGLPWTDEMRLWGAVAQLLLGITYGLYAWGAYQERWAHIAAWLGAASGGFLAITYSTGRGSSAAKAALLAIVFILAERGLHWLRQRPGVRNRQQAFIRLTWHLYKRPLLVTGWIMSAAAIGLALIRNLWLLNSAPRVHQTWAVVGLLLITGLYALSARLFRQARFMWLAAILIFAPWTILTHLGWYTAYRPTLPGFALSWVILAWLLFLAGLIVSHFAPYAYALPLKTVTHALLPFSLLWGIADVDTSRFTFGLAIGLYGLAAILDSRELKYTGEKIKPGKTKFLYPTLGLIPIWCVYLIAWLLPTARHEHYGLMFLAFGPLGLAAGQWLKQAAPNKDGAGHYALPGYLTGYVSLFVGTMLVVHEPPLLTLALLFDALLLLVSAYLFKNPLWLYPATALAVPISLLLALHEAGVASNRYGWWLIGLASIYLALAWVLRRSNLPAYGTATLTTGFLLIALSLPLSSQDQTGALWGYGGAALLYAITAFWLRQPLLLTPASALAVVPYAIGLQKSTLNPEYYGLALLPGAVVALALGWWLEHRFGSWQDFPWENPTHWLTALIDRWLNWWGLPLYILGFGLAIVSPFFTGGSGRVALNFLFLMPIFGWAIYRFRLRIWLLATALAGHLAVIYFWDELGWWYTPTLGWLRFLPVTLIMALVALFIERYRDEGPPLLPERTFQGWSRPLYIMMLFDIIAAQLLSLEGSWAGTMITLTHTLLIAVLASFWLSSGISYVSLILGVVALIQWSSAINLTPDRLPIVLAMLTLGYGITGYVLMLFRNNLDNEREIRPWLVIWELPLQGFSIGLSFGILVLTAWLGLDVIGWTMRAMFGFPFRDFVDPATVQMVVGVLALLGLLYLAAAFTHRRPRLGYVAMGMLLTSWILQVFYIQKWDNLQWYAIPAGLYLLGIAYLEWQGGNKVLGRWLDYLAMLLMMGSLFWQTLLFGWGYALLLGGEGLVAVWWGSARRLRRFLYAGMVGVVLATVGQLINSLWSINQWIVFGIIGLLLVVAAIVIERKLEDIKVLREVLETWE